VSLFTNVPDSVIESINRKWEMIQVNTTIPKDEFINAVKLTLNSTFFQFNNTIYK